MQSTISHRSFHIHHGLLEIRIGSRAEWNNENVISGIENPTVIDSFNSSQWRMIKYLISISKVTGGDNKFYATELSILIDGQNLNVSEYGTLDNNGDIGTISVSREDGVIYLVVTPNPAIRPITVRFARIGLKA